jgi:YD repeat-containing protein
MRFDGKDDIVTVPDSDDLDFTTAFTLEAWVKPQAELDWGTVLIKERPGDLNYMLHAAHAGHGPAGYVDGVEEGWTPVASEDPLPVGSWSHLALTLDGENLRLYVNGVLKAIEPAEPITTSNNPLQMGGNLIWGEEDSYKGLIDEVRLYDRALSEKEIEEDRSTALQTSAGEGPVAAYSFDEGEGATLTDLAGENDGELKNGAEWAGAGKFGGAMRFDGKDDIVTVPDSDDLDFTTAFTLEAWVRPEERNVWSSVLTKERGGSLSYQIHAEGPGRPAAYIDTSEGAPAVTGEDALPVKTWSHLALTYDEEELRLYVNGELEGTSPGAGSVTTSAGPLQIGGNVVWGEDDSYKGLIDEVRLYDRALSEKEIEEDRSAPSGTPAAPPHDRVQMWKVPNYVPDYKPLPTGGFGSSGSGNGAFDAPGDVEVDSNGNIWVADTGNDRIQKFNSSGVYLAKFGTSGSADGQFDRPSALAFDPDGNLLVADSGNDRIQVFDAEGGFERKFGESGSEDAEFDSPEGITVTADGEIWVADTGNSRVQVFDPEGEHLRTLGSEGSDPGEFQAPLALDSGALGSVFVADSGNDRVQEIAPDGDARRAFGVSGSDPGQLENPRGLEVDKDGIVWVADGDNDRVQGFGENGEHVRTLGKAGSGPGQLASPSGIATDSAEQLLVVDSGNDRLQRWATPGYAALEQFFELSEAPNDPEVAVETSGDLIESVEGDESGEHSYEHEGDDLIAHDGPNGETSFEYDGAGLMTGVALPNGTVAAMVYEEGSNRIESVTVHPASSEPETTYFTYNDEEMKTIVERPAMPAVEYLYDESGAVLKMWNAAEPPEMILSGTLWGGRETQAPISSGLHNLEATAHSEHGVSSIEMLDGNVIASEKHCAQDPKVEGIECKELVDEWVLETEWLAPGIHAIEVLVTDELDQTTSRRFWVNIPESAPLPQGEEERPRFAEILRYRVDHGLDLDLDPVTQESALNDRIFDLMRAWGNPHTPLGEVARYGTANWGVPMRPIDVAEMEYREWYIRENGPRIEAWGEEHATAYAGYEVDHAAGGQLRVRFAANVDQNLEELNQNVALVAPARVGGAVSPTGTSLAGLRLLQANIASSLSTSDVLAEKLRTVSIDTEAGVVVVGASNVPSVEGELDALFGTSVPIAVVPASPLDYSSERVMAGQNIRVELYDEEYSNTVRGFCTSAYGAERTVKRANGEKDRIEYLLTAGHCSEPGFPVRKFPKPRGEYVKNQYKIGAVAATALKGTGPIEHPNNVFETDVLAVKLADGFVAPNHIYWPGSDPRRVTPAGFVHPGDELCFSGTQSGIPNCGPFMGLELVDFPFLFGKDHGVAWEFRFDTPNTDGDSGSPVWNKTTNMVVGIISGDEQVIPFPDVNNERTVSLAVPLIEPKNFPDIPTAEAPGALRALEIPGLDLVEAR